ncbi:MAG: PqqD family peptide modification chaperone [Nocardioides sp.]
MTAHRLGIAEHVAWVVADEMGLDRTELYVAVLPAGPPLMLRDAAWAIWLALAETGTLDEVVARTAELTQSDPADIAPAVATFVDGLVTDGLAVRRPGP